MLHICTILLILFELGCTESDHHFSNSINVMVSGMEYRIKDWLAYLIRYVKYRTGKLKKMGKAIFGLRLVTIIMGHNPTPNF